MIIIISNNLNNNNIIITDKTTNKKKRAKKDKSALKSVFSRVNMMLCISILRGCFYLLTSSTFFLLFLNIELDDSFTAFS